jgi:predicted RNA-binding Zn-ribbon protein involved in translation (DUF1610 family)
MTYYKCPECNQVFSGKVWNAYTKEAVKNFKTPIEEDWPGSFYYCPNCNEYYYRCNIIEIDRTKFKIITESTFDDIVKRINNLPKDFQIRNIKYELNCLKEYLTEYADTDYVSFEDYELFRDTYMKKRRLKPYEY